VFLSLPFWSVELETTKNEHLEQAIVESLLFVSLTAKLSNFCEEFRTLEADLKLLRECERSLISLDSLQQRVYHQNMSKFRLI
jgi:hypothetical protein